MLEKIKKYLREYIALQGYQLLGKIRLWQFKRAVLLRQLANYNIVLGIRISDTDAKQIGYDDQKDGHINVARWKLTNPEYFDDELFEKSGSTPSDDYDEFVGKLRLDYEANKAEIDEIIENSLKLKFVNKWLEQYLLVQCYLCQFGHQNEVEREYFETRLNEFNETPVFFQDKDIEKKISDAKKDGKSASFELSDREALKIKVDLNSVGSLLGVFSTLALAAGFTHSYFFYKFFGIKTSNYFTISDYLSSSIESLYVVFLSVMVSMAFMFFGVHNASRKPVALIEHQKSKPDYIYLIIAVTLPLSIISGLMIGGRMLHIGISTAILLTGFLFIPKFARKFFDNYLISLLSVMVVVTFTSQLYGKIYNDIYDVLEGNGTQAACEVLELDSNFNIGADPCNMLLLGGTSEYIFLYDKPNERTYVVSRSKITLGMYNADRSRKNIFDILSAFVRSSTTGDN